MLVSRPRNQSQETSVTRVPCISELGLFIDGAWKKNGGGGKSEEVINPATEKPLATLPHANKADLDAALEAAKKGFAVWKATSAYDRCQDHGQGRAT